MTEQALAAASPKSLFADMAGVYGMERAAFESTIRKTIMPAGINPTNEQLAAFLLVAHQYELNPFTKEIYAFPTKAGGIQPIVPVDGWIKIINRHPEFDGMDIAEEFDNDGKIRSVTCSMYRRDRKHPVIVTEYFTECVRDTIQWKDKPIRMLRHKAVIQAARYCFGFAGIMEPDEADRMIEMGAAEVVTVSATEQKLADLRNALKPTPQENIHGQSTPAAGSDADPGAAPDRPDRRDDPVA